MMPATHQDLDSSSTTSTPRADHHDLTPPRIRFMCSFGGKILPRPHDNQLRYVGGDTRIIAVGRHTSFSTLLSKLAKTVGTVDNFTVKYQLPSEDLDALISVSNDEDVENMMDECERIGLKAARLRLFLFHDLSRTSSISSLLDGSTRRESWFFDALNGGGSTAGVPVLERGLSEASSIVSEVPDYLFGLDSSDEPAAQQLREPRVRTRSNLADCISRSDPGSPAPVMSTPFFSTSSAATAPQIIPDLLPVKTNIFTSPPALVARVGRQVEVDPPISMPAGLVQSSPVWRQYNPDPHYSGLTGMTSYQPLPVYYIPGPVQPANYPVPPAQFVQQQPVGYHPAGMGMGQIPSGGGMMRPMGLGLDSYDAHGRLVAVEGSSHPPPGYYGPVIVTAAGMEDHVGSGSDAIQ